MPDALLLLAIVFGGMVALVAWRVGRAEVTALARRHEGAMEDRRAAVSRAEAAELEAAHRAERLSEVQRLHADIDAQFRRAHDERLRLGASEAKLLEAMGGLQRGLDEAKAERAAIQARLDQAVEDVAELRVENRALQAAAEAQDDKLALLLQARQSLSDHFKALAGEVLKVQGEGFARSHQERLTTLLVPVREQVERFQGELRQAHASAATERALLKQEIERLSQSSKAISEEAVALTRALRGDKQRQGAWGEMLLERILEESGLREGLHYERQAKARSEEGARLRPDVVLKLPGGRRLVIDSKVSLNAYADAVAAEDEAQAARHLSAHVAAVKAHVDALSAKDYASAVGGSVDYVMMFMPVESALGAAWRHQEDLAAHAIARHIAIVTPTTLLTVLRTVQHVWAVEERHANADRIAKRAGLLYDKVAGFVGDLEKVGLHLDRAQGAYGDAMGKLATGHGNLLGQVEKLRALGARTTKALAIEFDGAPDDGETDDEESFDGGDGGEPPPAIEAAE